MVYLITGGAGFIGRWVVNELLKRGIKVVIIDNFSNARERNIKDFVNAPNFREFVKADIKNRIILSQLFDKFRFSTCIHLAAQINVQESLDHPERSFENNVIGTYNILENALRYNTKVILVGTCMVYDLASSNKPISEQHPLKPTSPYAGTKLAAEEIALSYYYSFGLPIVILRPFNTYGPFQKTNMEGGVVSIFIKRKLNNQKLLVYGDGSQTRDFLYVEDCARFIIKASESEKSIGEIINAGSGSDICINDLAKLIINDESKIEHIEHHHPQSEIMKLICDNSKAKRILNWEPEITLGKGIIKLENWIKKSEVD